MNHIEKDLKCECAWCLMEKKHPKKQEQKQPVLEPNYLAEYEEVVAVQSQICGDSI